MDPLAKMGECERAERKSCWKCVWNSLLISFEFSSRKHPLVQEGRIDARQQVGWALRGMTGVRDGLSQELCSNLDSQCSKLIPTFPLLSMFIE